MNTKNNKKKLPYLTKLVLKLAPKIGAKVLVEPKWGVAAQIIYKNGIVRSLRFYSLDLNPIASADIAKDKDYAKFFLKKKGYSVADGQAFFKDSWADAIKSNRNVDSAALYANKKGYPLIVKPNSQSQGSGVSVVNNEKELRSALKIIFNNDKIALVESYLPGRDYRIVVLDKKIISAYERTPLSVIGDGKSSVLLLLKQKQKNFKKKGRDTKLNFKDPRILHKLKRQGLSFTKVLPKEKRIFLLDNANLSTGGDSIDVTNSISPGFRKIATEITRDMGLRLAGVDIMVTRGDITKNPKNSKYYIIEINAAPGLDHYVTTGSRQRKIVETMYLEVLKALGKKD